MMVKRFRFLVLLLSFVFLASGCYYYEAKKEMDSAGQLVSQLKNAGGPQKVPYEYTSAEKFLEISKMEFDEYDYKQARDFATRSKSAAQAGLAQAK